MEDGNARMAAMEAQFQETIAKLREDLTSRLRVEEAARQGPGVTTSVNYSLIRLHYSTRSPPKMPNDPAKTLSWIRRFEIFLGSESLTHMLTTILSTGPVDVISCNDRFFLKRMHGVQTVCDNWKVWQYLLEATCNTDIEEKLAACNSVHEAWGVVTEWTLPASEAEKTLLAQQLENVTMYPDEDPKTFFTRVDKLVNMMRRVGITKTEEQIVHVIVRQLSDEYMVQKAIIDANPAEYPRVRVEHLVRNAYVNRKVKEVMQSNVPSLAAQRDPHALAVGGFRQGRGGGSGGQRSGSGGFVGMVEGSSNVSGHTEVKYSSSVRQALGNSSSRTNRDVRSSNNSNSSSSSSHTNGLLTTHHLVIQHGDPGVNSIAGATLHTFKRNRFLLQALRWALSTYAPGVGGMVTLLTSALHHPVSRATAGPVASMDTCAATALLLPVLRAPSSMQTSFTAAVLSLATAAMLIV